MLAEPHVPSPGPSTSDCKNHLLQRQVEGVHPFSQQIASQKIFIVFFSQHFVSKELANSKHKPTEQHLTRAPAPGFSPSWICGTAGQDFPSRWLKELHTWVLCTWVPRAAAAVGLAGACGELVAFPSTIASPRSLSACTDVRCGGKDSGVLRAPGSHIRTGKVRSRAER